MYKKENLIPSPINPTCPELPHEEASAPPLENINMTTECVICMDSSVRNCSRYKLCNFVVFFF